MNSENLARKLIEAARADAPLDRVPYAFETRITARLHSGPALAMDVAAVWARALWLAAVPYLAIPLLLGFWAVAPAPSPTADSRLLQDIEETLYASVEQQVVDLEEQ